MSMGICSVRNVTQYSQQWCFPDASITQFHPHRFNSHERTKITSSLTHDFWMELQKSGMNFLRRISSLHLHRHLRINTILNLPEHARHLERGAMDESATMFHGGAWHAAVAGRAAQEKASSVLNVSRIKNSNLNESKCTHHEAHGRIKAPDRSLSQNGYGCIYIYILRVANR